MSGHRIGKSIDRSKTPMSLAVWLRYQVESIPHVAARDGQFSARCAAVSLRMKLGGALRANLIDPATAAELNAMLDQVERIEEPA